MQRLAIFWLLLDALKHISVRLWGNVSASDMMNGNNFE
jgi:hypothetical protein